MVSSRYGARLSQTDVTDLANASAAIAELAHTIQRANPVWAAASVQVLITVNATIVRIQNKGAEAFARYLRKRGLNPAPTLTEELGLREEVPEGGSMPLNEEES